MNDGRFSNLPEVAPAEVSVDDGTNAPTTYSQLPEPVEPPEPLEPSEPPKYDTTDNRFEEDVGRPAGGSNGQKILGLPRKWFFVVAGIVAVIIVGAIVGGAVGGTVGKDKDSHHTPVASTAPDAPMKDTPKSAMVLGKSTLSAVNWTDASNTKRYGVFFQNGKNEIMASFRNESDSKWKTINVSKKLSPSSVDIKEGGSISAIGYVDTSGSPTLRLYAVASDNMFIQLAPGADPATDGWSQTDLGTQIRITIGKHSNIAAWQPWIAGSDLWYPVTIVWQDDEGTLHFRTGADDWGSTVDLPLAAKGTGIGLTSVFHPKNYSQSDYKLYYDDNGVLRETFLNYGDNAIPNRYSEGGTLTEGTTTLSTSNFAATYFDYSDILVTNIDENGGPQARWWHASAMKWSKAVAPTLKNSPKGFPSKPKFTAIATHQDQKVYGIVDGKIYEWSYEINKPLIWTYVSEVSTKAS